MKNKVFIISDFYKPGFLAGGPIQSIFNLANLLANDFDIYIFTKNFDLNNNDKPYNLDYNKWLQQENKSLVKYVNSFSFYFNGLRHLFQIKPDVIYLNSLFAFGTQTNLFQSLIFSLFYKCKIIIAPRGQLDKGALSIKPFKKHIFISIFRIFSSSKIIFHATTDQEKNEILKYIRNKKVLVANNIPQIIENRFPKNKEAFISKFIFVSRICQKKNLLYAIECFNITKTSGRIEFIIIGPIEDKKYWEKCKLAILKLPKNISCKVLGPLQHDEINLVLKVNHYLFFPTLAENFGHVIYEALINGLPILISDNTPWENGDKNGVFALPLSNQELFIETICKLHELNFKEYEILSKKAFQYAKNKVNLADIKHQYLYLFQ